MEGNAVIGYNQIVDDEGLKSNRIVIRGFGTAVVLDKENEHKNFSHSELGKLLKQQPTAMKKSSTAIVEAES
jgi:hypothetical protein